MSWLSEAWDVVLARRYEREVLELYIGSWRRAPGPWAETSSDELSGWNCLVPFRKFDSAGS